MQFEESEDDRASMETGILLTSNQCVIVCMDVTYYNY